MQIGTLISQHKHMLKIVDRITGLRPEKDAPAIADALAELKQCLLAHLETEDRFLYPALRHYGDRPEAPIGLKTNIKKFFDEMEAIKPGALSFLDTWTAPAITAQPAVFREAFAGIADALAQRIAREESRLYPHYTTMQAASSPAAMASASATIREQSASEDAPSLESVRQRGGSGGSGGPAPALLLQTLCWGATAGVVIAGALAGTALGTSGAGGPVWLEALLGLAVLATAVVSALGALQARRMAQGQAAIHATIARLGAGEWRPSPAEGNAPGVVEALLTMRRQLSSVLSTVRASAEQVSAYASTISQETNRFAMAASLQAQETEAAAGIMEDLVTAMHQVARNADSLASGMDETCASVAEMVASIEQVGSHVAEAYHRETDAAQVAAGGQRMVADTIAGMARIENAMSELLAIIEELSQSSEEIGAITSLIDDLADQTNLLALNATIEAARAGEHGRGFAVVAQEVKRLADGSARATHDIALRLQGIQRNTKRLVTSTRQGEQAVQEGVQLAEAAGRALQEIVTAVKESAALMQQIATATEEQRIASEQITTRVESMTHMTKRVSKATAEQRRGSEQVVTAIETINAASRESAHTTEAMAQSAERFAALCQSLIASLAYFRLKPGAELVKHVPVQGASQEASSCV
ncbi:MAG TPA: methyl-accepting chemotaxis protein [Oscillatoriaceae cyanobacterium]